MLQDLRYCLRQLIKTPGFTLTSILSLTLGIGATTAVFSVVYAILMDPYPYKASDRMVHMRLVDNTGQDRGFGLTANQWQTIRKSPVVEDSFASQEWSLTLTGRDLPEDVEAAYFTSNGFQFFGVPMALGRDLLPSDAIDGQDPQQVAVLSYKFWQRHFASDRAILGRNIELLHKTYTIVGVAPPRFTWDDADVYLPMKVDFNPARTHYVGIRLKPGVGHKEADAALSPLIDQFAKETPKHFPTGHFKFKVVGLNEDFEKRLGGTLYLLFGAVGFLLLIGCGNVSILQLARGTARQNEFAVRAAIGAGRGRLVRQMLVEALLVSLTGAALGVLLAYRLVHVIADLLPKYSFPHEAKIALNVPVLLFSVALAIVTGVLFGLWPSLQLSRPDLLQAIQASARRVTGGSRGRRLNQVLVAGQIALTLVMLAASGAAMRGFLHLLNTPLGYDPHNVVSVGIPVHDGTYTTWEARANYFELLRAKAALVPGVEMTAISTNATPPNNGWNTNIETIGKAQRDEQKVGVNFVSHGYFPLLRIRLVAGRFWDETDDHNARRYAVINETLARRYFPDGAVGRAIKIPDLQNEPPFNLSPKTDDPRIQIIGVIADKRDDGLRNPILPELFIPYKLSMHMWTQILVRSAHSPLPLVHSIAQQVNSVNADQQVAPDTEDLDQWIRDQPEWAQERLVAWLFGAFAFLAVALAATGLYSVMSFAVQRRTNEFGIRMALGAQPADVLRLVFSSAGVTVGLGVTAGILLTVVLNRVLAQWAAGSSRDLIVLCSAAAILSAVAAMACAAPAHRASSVDPMTALRYE